MVFVDTNAFVVLVLGLIDTGLYKNHPRASIYEEEDFNILIDAIGTFENVITTPNIITELDNLLNNFSGNYKFPYLKAITEIIHNTSEHLIKSSEITSSYHFSDLGVTDSVILHLRDKYDLLITTDSRLSDYARSLDIRVLDLVANRNERLK